MYVDIKQFQCCYYKPSHGGITSLCHQLGLKELGQLVAEMVSEMLMTLNISMVLLQAFASSWN